jgi:trimeric autotransporter adhesin
MSLFNRVSRRVRSFGRKRAPVHLTFELCEDRVLLALLVTTAADNGDNTEPTSGSLRQAILIANSTPGLDTIDFNIPGPGPFIIQPPTPLPTITDQVFLDGTTQRTFLGLPAAGPPIIQVNGNGLSVDGLVLSATTSTSSAGSTITGLDIYSFSLSGNGSQIHIQTPGNKITGNFLGTDVTGTAAAPDNHFGVLIDSNASGNTIGGTGASGNVISGNRGTFNNPGDGIQIFSDSNLVQGNKIGTTAAGTGPLGNGFPGQSSAGGAGLRFFSGTANTISDNVISGNVNEGIFSFPSGNHETILDNFIGTNDAGNALGNGRDGIKLQSANNTIGGNVISGNGNNGVWINHSGATNNSGASNNVVLSNYIGVGADGNAPLPNQGDGVLIDSGLTGNTIGGTAAGAGNVVSGNHGDGIGVLSAGNLVQGNKIGTNAAGNAALGNGIPGAAAGGAGLRVSLSRRTGIWSRAMTSEPIASEPRHWATAFRV